MKEENVNIEEQEVITHDAEKNVLYTEKMNCESQLKEVENQIEKAVIEGGDTFELLQEKLRLRNRIDDIVIEINAYDGIEQTDEEKLALAKARKIAEISIYDRSSAVNEFTYAGIPMWLDKDTRTGLSLRLNAEKSARKQQTTLWLGTQSFTLTPAEGLQMLNALELYASECFDVTSSHKAAVMAQETVEAVEAYDITADYPSHPSFGE